MIDKMPGGKLIGTMDAPLSWIFSHTARFVGIVRITIQDGEGFLLIEKGKIRSSYFQHGHRVLLGHAAEDYFSTQPLIHFSMYTLTSKEFSTALSTAGAEGPSTEVTEPRAEPVSPAAAVTHPDSTQDVVTPVILTPPEPPVAVTPASQQPVIPSTSREQPPDISDVSEQKTTPPPKDIPHSKEKEDGDRDIPAAPLDSGPQGRVKEKTITEQHPVKPKKAGYPVEELLPKTDLRMIAQIMLGRIKTLQGVIAVLVFNKDMQLISIGEVNLDAIVTAAEDMLMTVNQLDAVIEWGSFVQMTLQIPSGNVIIAPFFDEYLCILTSPDINLGRVRRILREIKTQQIQ